MLGANSLPAGSRLSRRVLGANFRRPEPAEYSKKQERGGVRPEAMREFQPVAGSKFRSRKLGAGHSALAAGPVQTDSFFQSAIGAHSRYLEVASGSRVILLFREPLDPAFADLHPAVEARKRSVSRGMRRDCRACYGETSAPQRQFQSCRPKIKDAAKAMLPSASSRDDEIFPISLDGLTGKHRVQFKGDSPISSLGIVSTAFKEAIAQSQGRLDL